MIARLVLKTDCKLGEGPVWAYDRLVFFDINANTLHHCAADGSQHEVADLHEHGSAAATTSDGRLLIATQTALKLMDTDTGDTEILVPLEADNPVTRSNDGRADRQGGFWIGTMGKQAETGAGALYRYFRGELRRLCTGLTIPNAICFSPDAATACFTDTRTRKIMSWPLDSAGWPIGKPAVFLDLSGTGFNPDGAVIDSAGHMWCAMWGAGCLLRFAPDGTGSGRIDLPASRPTCPAFGPDLHSLFITSARQGMSRADLAAEPLAGGLFVAQIDVAGLREPAVIIP